MKKFLIFFVVVVIIIAGIGYLYFNYSENERQVISYNANYEKLLNKEITGTDLATYINKIYDTNQKNGVSKDENNFFIENDTNSTIADIKFIDNDSTFKIESIYQADLSQFINLYSNRIFKCTKIEYHKNTNLISYLHFDEIDVNSEK